MPKSVMLIRHGHTKWNAEGRYMGFADIGLDDLGLLQAERLRRRLGQERVDRIYASDSRRAFDFASIIWLGRMVIKVPDLREMNFGAIEGMTYEEIQIRYPREYGLWLEDIGSSNILEGESMRDLKGRVLSAFDAIVSDDGDRSLAIVTHAGPISVILNSIVRSDDFWGMMPNPASLSLIEFEDGLPKIVVVNDTSHLTNT